jgi:hypothetical protein
MPTEDYDTCVANIEDAHADQSWRGRFPDWGQDLEQQLKIAVWGLLVQFLDFAYPEQVRTSGEENFKHFAELFARLVSEDEVAEALVQFIRQESKLKGSE